MCQSSSAKGIVVCMRMRVGFVIRLLPFKDELSNFSNLPQIEMKISLSFSAHNGNHAGILMQLGRDWRS